MNLPEIFNSKAEFVEPADLTGLDAATVARLDGVRVAYRNLKSAQDSERAAVQTITDCTQSAADAEAYRNKYFPPSTPHDEWITNFGNAAQRRDLARRRAGL